MRRAITVLLVALWSVVVVLIIDAASIRTRVYRDTDTGGITIGPGETATFELSVPTDAQGDVSSDGVTTWTLKSERTVVTPTRWTLFGWLAPIFPGLFSPADLQMDIAPPKLPTPEPSPDAETPRRSAGA